MANKSFIQPIVDVTDDIELKRFLDRLVEIIDIIYANRGKKEFATVADILSNATTISGLRDDLNNAVTQLNTKIDNEFHPEPKQAPQPLDNTATTADIINKINELIQTLKDTHILN